MEINPLTIIMIEQQNIIASQSDMECPAPKRNGKLREITNPDTLVRLGLVPEKEEA